MAAKTDLEKYIDRINTARKNNFITSSEATSLRQLARQRANARGDFGPKDRDVLNESFREALNNRGENALNQGQLPIGVTPGQPLPQPNRQPQRVPPPPPAPRPPPPSPPADTAFDKWVDRYQNLGKSDKDFVRSLVKGDPTSLAFWKTLSRRKRDALKRVVNPEFLAGNDINREERDYLRKIFDGATVDYPSAPQEKPGREEGGREPEDETGGGDEGAGDDGEEGGVGSPPTGSRPGTVGQDPTETVANQGRKFTKIKFPDGGETTKFIPSESERIFMPNIESKVTKQIERLTLNLIDFTREFIEAGQDYKSIDYIPLQEVFNEDDVLYFVGQDPSSPMANQEDDRSFITELINDLVQAIRILLSQGDESNPAYKPRPGPEYVWYNNAWFFFGGDPSRLPSGVSWTWDENVKIWVDPNNPPPGLAPGEEAAPTYNYAKFLELFSITYTESGDPVYTFNIELDDGIIPGEIELTTQYNSVDIEDDTLDE